MCVLLYYWANKLMKDSFARTCCEHITWTCCVHRQWKQDVGDQWRRQDFVTGGSEVWVYSGSRVRSLPVPVVLSVYQRGSLLDDLAMYLSCDTKKFHDDKSTHILHNFWTSTHRGKLPPTPLAAPLLATDLTDNMIHSLARCLLDKWPGCITNGRRHRCDLQPLACTLVFTVAATMAPATDSMVHGTTSSRSQRRI